MPIRYFPTPHCPLRQSNPVIAQPFVAALINEIIVLDADAADAFDVEAGLESDDVAGEQGFVGVADDVGSFGMR